MRDRPSTLGQQPDGPSRKLEGVPPHREWGVCVRHAIRTPFFWVVTSGLAATGLLSTAVNFHQISLLAERRLTATEAAGNFLWQTIAALLATLGTGMLSDRIKPRWLIVAAMVALAGGLALGTVVTPGLVAIAFGALIGTSHIGAIRGVVTAISVGSTAFGPLIFALGYDLADTYGRVLLATVPIPLLVAVTALFIHPPKSR